MVWVLKWQICRKAVTPFCNTVPCGRRVMWSHIFPTTGRRPRAQLQMSEEEVRSYSVYKPGLNPGEMLWEQLDCVVHSKCPSNRFDLRQYTALCCQDAQPPSPDRQTIISQRRTDDDYGPSVTLQAPRRRPSIPERLFFFFFLAVNLNLSPAQAVDCRRIFFINLVMLDCPLCNLPPTALYNIGCHSNDAQVRQRGILFLSTTWKG